MSAPTHTRSLPSGPLRSGPFPSGHRAGAVAGAGTRLHWWALALPALAFGLLLLLAGSGEAHPATGETSALAQVIERLLRAVG
ncbi:hypothetical protein ABZX75_14995 [Streptomyces sp. NPDC003038]|uniref:hypothetical protein n=1 Tax=unclassified Streptomyces TaxID=2593676 RepID=UPI0033A3902C